MLDFILSNWYIIVAAAVIAAVIAIYVYRFAGLPTQEQLAKVREWLLYAVTTAEAELGGGTGQLKLRTVYDMFVQRFPGIAKMISFEIFSDLVDDALVEMRDMLAKNEAVAAIVGGDEA